MNQSQILMAGMSDADSGEVSFARGGALKMEIEISEKRRRSSNVGGGIPPPLSSQVVSRSVAVVDLQARGPGAYAQITVISIQNRIS
jgi:hypothetical protein